MRSDGMMVDGFKTRLISFKSKLLMTKMLLDGLAMKKSLSYYNLGSAAAFDTETAAEYCDRCANEELKEYIVEPAVRALYTATASRVSKVDFFYALVNFTGTGFMQYTGGIDFLVQALARHLDITLKARVTHVEQKGQQVDVSWEQDDGVRCAERCDACVITLTGKEVPGIYPQINPTQKDILLNQFDYCTTFNAHLGLDYRPDEPSFLVQVPPSEDEGLCAVTFDHNSSPQLVPPGKGMLSSYWVHPWCEKRYHLSDEKLLEEMYPAFEKVVPGVRKHVKVAHIDRWRPAVLMSKPGTYHAMAEFNRHLDSTLPIQLAGDYFCASSCNASALSGEMAAQRLSKTVFGV
jgi:oxygen-dependent protoporphyrinogen oxidase